jgi:hypothetical protein
MLQTEFPQPTPRNTSVPQIQIPFTAFFNHTTEEKKRSCIINISIIMMQDQVKTRMQNMNIKEQKMARK